MGIRHINTVIAHPERFGLTLGQIKAIYRRNRERIGQKGKAREKIMTELIKAGWVRTRRQLYGLLIAVVLLNLPMGGYF